MNKQTIRLQVFLSRNGVCSRREAMDIIKEGSVKVNGKVQSEPSFQVDPLKDKIMVGKKEVASKQYDYILLNKPAGYVTTKAQHKGQKNIYHVLPEEMGYLLPVGRLDKDTEGLLLLTNDGDVAYGLTHPKFDIDKTYYVKIGGKLENFKKEKLEKGVRIEGVKTAPAKITSVKHIKTDTELKITIHEGKKRQIRLMFESVGHRVKYLKRLVQGPLKLGDLKIGSFRKLTVQEIKEIKKIND